MAQESVTFLLFSKTGLNASTSGRLGPGLYLTTKDEAFKIAKYRNSGTGVAVFEVHVNVGKTYDNGSADDNSGSWASKGYDSCTGNHPAWCDNASFKEWVIKDPRKIRIKAVHLVDGVIDGDFSLKRIDFHVSGNCNFRGNHSIGGTLYVSGCLTIG